MKPLLLEFHLLLEFRLLRKELPKMLVLSFSIPILGFLLLMGNGIFVAKLTTSKILNLLLGSVNNLQMGWMYWIFLCFGYLLLLQFLWKPHVHMFEVYQILRYNSVALYWETKLIIGLLFTIFYMICWLGITFAVSLLLHSHFIWDLHWLIVFVCLTLNLYIHALIWFAIKIYTAVEIALTIVSFLFYSGVRIVQPYVPLYYAMQDNLRQFLLPTFIVELLVICILVVFIIWHVKNKDFD